MKKSVEGLKTSKITGGKRHPLKTRQKFQIDRYPNEALMGEQETATRKTRGNNRKTALKTVNHVNLVLPNAKIIDIRRNSMSACFSCYKQLFAEGQEFTYSFERLGNYYNTYIDLMDHWNKVLPNQILSINYEDVVNNFEDSVRDILEYCEIPFEKECLEFYKSKRSVKTPSAEQVRQPIYTSGMDYWKNYEPYLDDLKNNLKY